MGKPPPRRYTRERPTTHQPRSHQRPVVDDGYIEDGYHDQPLLLPAREIENPSAPEPRESDHLSNAGSLERPVSSSNISLELEDEQTEYNRLYPGLP